MIRPIEAANKPDGGPWRKSLFEFADHCNEEIIRRVDAAITGGAVRPRPSARQYCERGEPALRVI